MDYTANRAHHWKTSTDPNAGSGTLLTDQEGNNNGTLNAGMFWAIDELGFDIINTNNVDGQVLFDAPLDLVGVDNTVVLWVKPNDVPLGNRNWFTNRFTASNRSFLQHDTAGRPIALYYPGSNRARRALDFFITPDQWLNVIATWNSATQESPTLYLNGSTTGNDTGGGQASSSLDRLTLGGRTQDPAADQLASRVDEVTVFTNRIFTADEAAIYAAHGPGPRIKPTPTPLPGTMAWYSPDVDPANPNPSGLLRDLAQDVDGYLPNAGTVESQPGFGGDLALRLDGTPASGDQQHVNMSDVDVFDGLRAFSISGWYKSAGNNSNSTAHTLAAKYSPSGQLDDRGFVLNVDNSNGQWFFQLATDEDGVFNRTASILTTVTDWNHVAVTWDGTTIRMFVNNQDAGSSAADDGGGLRPNSRPFMVGRSWNNFNANGWIDDLRFFDRALSEAEVEDLFSSRGYQPGVFIPAVAVPSTLKLG